MRHNLGERVLQLLGTEPLGLGEPEIRRARTAVPTLRSRRLHQHAAARLAGNPSLRDLARERLQKLRQVNPHGRVCHDRWAALLDGSLPALLRTMTEVSEQADSLRKESPFTVLINAEDRRRIFESVRAA